MNANTLEFLASGTIEELNYGIEIEFSNAGNLANESGPQYDEDDAESSLNDNAVDWIENFLGCTSSIARELMRHGSLEDFINGFTRYSWSSFVSDELDSMNENSDSEPAYDDIDGWNHEEDATSGIVQEYQSKVGTLSKTMERVQWLFKCAGSECKVPLNGSCHIHVSIPGSAHSATNESALHCCLLYELSQHIKEFPEAVIERLNSARARAYFEFSARCTQKFSAIHMHHQGTWEFRLFGHMDDPADIETCLNIAGKAFLSGYKRFASESYSIPSAAEFRNHFSECMELGVAMPVASIEELEMIGCGE